jgi:hypothetical protein
VTTRNDSDNDLADDPTHPIPYVNNIDVIATTDKGGTYRGLVIAAPLECDARSLNRLRAKVVTYLEDARASAQEHRPQGKARFWVAIHPASDTKVFEVLETLRSTIEDHGFHFRVTTNLKSFGNH